MRKLATAAMSAAALLALGASPAAAKQFTVDDDGAQCKKADFTSIQAAVTAAGPNDKVRVCPGDYEEQVRITGKDGLNLEATKKLEATIRFPAATTPPNALVHIDDSDDVTVRGFVISGPYTTPGCDPPATAHSGVFVDDSQDAEITENHITLIRSASASLFGCQDGLAVLVGRGSVGSAGSADISHNVIDLYQKGGVVIDNAGSSGQVDHNTIDAGTDLQPFLAPNGVQLSRGATGRVDHNTITNNHFGGNPAAGTGAGVILFEVSGVLVDHNEAFRNDDNIALYDTADSEVSHNEVYESLIYDGIYLGSDSAGNLVKANEAYDNAEHDCHDDSTGSGTSGTANEWSGNRGNTENRPGLCPKEPTP